MINDKCPDDRELEAGAGEVSVIRLCMGTLCLMWAPGDI